MNWFPSFIFLAACMNDLIGFDPSSGMAGILRNCWAGLGIAPTPAAGIGLTMSSITEADYTGYARQPVVWFPTFIDALGPQTVEAHNLQFQPSDAVMPNTITFLFLASALTAGNLLLCANAVPTVNLSDATSSLILTPTFQLQFNPVYGGPLVSA